MRKLRLLSLSLLSVTLIAVSCTKEGPEGPVGAIGAQGPPGTPGSKGDKGDKGDIGNPGSANVIYSTWVASVAADWIPGYIAPNNYNVELCYNRTAAGITQGVLDQGVVLCYGKNFTIGVATILPNVQLLPYRESFNGQSYSFVLALGKIAFTYDPDAPAPIRPISQLAGISYRYIIIPGGVAGGKMMSGPAKDKTVAELKTMSYRDVLATFHIPNDGTNIQ
ncbi:MAG: collagen-like protein [Bacteroidota bacterium]